MAALLTLFAMISMVLITVLIVYQIWKDYKKDTNHEVENQE